MSTGNSGYNYGGVPNSMGYGGMPNNLFGGMPQFGGIKPMGPMIQPMMQPRQPMIQPMLHRPVPGSPARVPGSPAPSPGANKSEDLAKELNEFYRTFDPNNTIKRSSVQQVVRKHLNDRAGLNKALRVKYGHDLEEIMADDGSESATALQQVLAVKPKVAFEPDSNAVEIRGLSEGTVQLSTLDRDAASIILDPDAHRGNGKPISTLTSILRNKTGERGPCACCDYQVTTDDERYFDGMRYYHQKCWDELKSAITIVKRELRTQKEGTKMREAFQKGVNSEIVVPVLQERQSRILERSISPIPETIET